MTPVLVASTGCQAGAFFNTEEIPPGVPRPRLPWGYSYAQFGALLDLYPGIHPEDFITFGVLNDQPRRGSLLEWQDAAGVLSHMSADAASWSTSLCPYSVASKIYTPGILIGSWRSRAWGPLLWRSGAGHGSPWGTGHTPPWQPQEVLRSG